MTYTSSQIGFATAVLATNRSPSQIGFATVNVLSSQRPVAVWNGTQLVYVPIRTWTGTKLL